MTMTRFVLSRIRNSQFVICILQSLFTATCVFAAPTQIRMVWKESPATEATLSWTTSEEGSNHHVKLRSEDEENWTTVASQRGGRFSGRTPNGNAPYFHHTRLTNLKPATKYHVICQSDGEQSRELHFTTAPGEDVPFSILFGGDSRSGLEARKKVNRMMARMVEEQIAAGRPAILAFAHGGDFIYDGRNLKQWLQWLSDHELTTTKAGRLLPIVPTRGNHDMGPLFDEIFDFPKGDGNYYTTDLSPEVRLTTLNTEISTAGDQREWLAEELLAGRWNRRWYLCQYHKPAFPAVKVPSGALTSWVPLFEKYRVDLVCEADGHNIKRTPPILGNKVDSEGVVYIGEGGLGVGQRTPKTARWFLQETADKCGSGHHVHLITFTREQIDCRVVLLNGEVFDEFSLEPRDPPKQSAAIETTNRELVTQ